MSDAHVHDKHILRCNNPRCKGTYIATLKILIDPSTIIVPHTKIKTIDIGVVENIKCPKCGMKSDITISVGVSNRAPQTIELPISGMHIDHLEG